MRLEPFLDESSSGSWQLMGGGGEAIVFGDAALQRVVKLLAPPGKARFGWIPERRPDGTWGLRPGGLAEALERFALFEECFASGLDIDAIGSEGDFLLLSQPFILGEHPDEPTLHAFMSRHGWEKCALSSELPMLRHQSWHRSGVMATDVRPENALVAQSDGSLVAIDFVIGRI